MLFRFKEMVEKLQADDRRMNDEIVDLTARLRKINSQLDETQNERHSLVSIFNQSLEQIVLRWIL